MKKKLPPFLAGMLTMALIASLGIGAVAATGQLTLTVDPVNIQVNGATFTPKDAKGNVVPVFAYGGTTYAPLRALAEAYGLEVGYDAKANMATVGETAAPATPNPDTALSTDYSTWTDEEEKAYQEFKGMWEVESVYELSALYTGSLSQKDLISQWKASPTAYEAYCRKMVIELNPNKESNTGVQIRFYYGDTEIAFAAVYSTGDTHFVLKFS